MKAMQHVMVPFLAVCGSSLALGANGTWSATPQDSDWANSANWNSGIVPGDTLGTARPSPETNLDVATFGASSILTVTPDANRALKSLTFTSEAGAYVIGGTNTLTVLAGGEISGNNTSTITFDAPVYFGGDYNVKPATGQTIEFNANVTQQAGRSFQLGSGNVGTITFDGAIVSATPTTGNPVNVRWLGGGRTIVNLNADNSAHESRVTLSFDAGNVGGVANLNSSGVIFSNTDRAAARVNLQHGGTVNVNAANAIGGTNASVDVGSSTSETAGCISLMVINTANSYGGPTTVGRAFTAGQTRTADQAILLVNNASGSATGDSDITVRTGILGGEGFIANTGNKGVTLLSHGVLSPGASAGEIGTLTMSLGDKGLNISDSVSDVNTQSLRFDLDTVASSDQIALTAGTLNIGTGGLEFDDFAFTVGGNFGAGVYTLFDTNAPISGTLGTSLSGILDGKAATLGLGDGGRDVILTVVPEPTSLAAMGLAAVGLMARRRRLR